MAEDIYMPQLGLTMTEGKVVRWLKAAGEPVRKGEPVLEVETDKVSVEIESPADGVLGPILVEAGASAPIGGMLSHVLAAGRAGARERGSGGARRRLACRHTATDRPLSSERSEESRAGPPLRPPAPGGRPPTLGVDLTQVEASGPGGRIVEADVRWSAETQIANRKSQIANPASIGVEALAGDRPEAPSFDCAQDRSKRKRRCAPRRWPGGWRKSWAWTWRK